MEVFLSDKGEVKRELQKVLVGKRNASLKKTTDERKRILAADWVRIKSPGVPKKARNGSKKSKRKESDFLLEMEFGAGFTNAKIIAISYREAMGKLTTHQLTLSHSENEQFEMLGLRRKSYRPKFLQCKLHKENFGLPCVGSKQLPN